MHTIENKHLQVTISTKGAELKTIQHKVNGEEYMWSGNPEYWSKTSPVLFPIVGTLKDNSYTYHDQAYQLSRHGFARDNVFSVKDQQDDSIRFTLESNEDTLAKYPFPFAFSIQYEIKDATLRVEYIVENLGDSIMPFSVGGHPAFKLPLVEGTFYDNYQLQFEKPENAGRWPISEDGLIETEAEPLLQNAAVLPLSKELFSKDAIVLKHLQSTWVKLHSPATVHGLTFHFKGFPYLGLWAAPGADFICIEPWCGIADSVDADGDIMHKEGIQQLDPGKTFSVSWSVDFY